MRIRTIFLAGLLLGAIPLSVRAQDLSGQVAEANRLYREGKFQEARDRYLEALRAQPELPQLHFNLGDALYKSKDFERALESFRESLSQASPELQADAWYNLGNALFQKGEMQKSLEAFKESLKLDPTDPDAKHNLEVVLQQLQEQPRDKQDQNQQDQDQQEQNQDSPKPEPDPQDQKQPGDKREQQQKEQEQPGEQPQNQPDQPGREQPESTPEQESGEEKAPQNPDPGQMVEKQMSAEEVKRLLDALKEDPEQFLKRKLVKPARLRVKKDW